jgi:hypothetical protein
LRHIIFSSSLCLLVVLILKLQFFSIFLRPLFIVLFLFFSISHLSIHIRLRITVFFWKFRLEFCVFNWLSVVHVIASIIRYISSNFTFYFFISSIVFSHEISPISPQVILKMIAFILIPFVLILFLVLIIFDVLWFIRVRLRFTNFVCFKILSQIKTLLSRQSWRFIVRSKRICNLLSCISILLIFFIIITSIVFFLLIIFVFHMHWTISSVTIWTSLIFYLGLCFPSSQISSFFEVTSWLFALSQVRFGVLWVESKHNIVNFIIK